MLWNSNYVIGNTLVDSEHKEIFEMVERLIAGDFKGRPDKIMTTVNFLMDYVKRHFDHEKRLMDESDYPQTDEHVKQHIDFVRVVTQLAEKIEGNLNSIDISLEVNTVIVNWLAEHVMGSDRIMIDHYRTWTNNANQGLKNKTL